MTTKENDMLILGIWIGLILAIVILKFVAWGDEMTKTELIKKITDIANQMSDVESFLDDAKSAAKLANRLIEDIPDDASEITDDED